MNALLLQMCLSWFKAIHACKSRPLSYDPKIHLSCISVHHCEQTDETMPITFQWCNVLKEVLSFTTISSDIYLASMHFSSSSLYLKLFFLLPLVYNESQFI